MPPVSGNATYISTADAMLSHWDSANDILAEDGPVRTAAGLDIAGLTTLRANVEAGFLAVVAPLNTVELRRAQLGIRKTRMRQLLAAFNETVRGRLATTTFPAALPAVPGGNDSATTVATAATDAANLWTTINSSAPTAGFTPPLVLHVPPAGDLEGTPVALPLATFQTELSGLNTDIGELRSAEQLLLLSRQDRDLSKKQLYDGMRDYRAAIPGYFTAADPIRKSLPALTPPPGSTPDPVTATAAWDEDLSQARIAFDASTTAAVDHYELRYCPGSEYSTEDETTIASAPATGPLEFLTLTGLAIPGATASYRVSTIATTGHESGSNTVSVTRPA